MRRTTPAPDQRRGDVATIARVLAGSQQPIVAIATAPGRAAVGIVRLSGTDLRPLLPLLCGRSLTPRLAHYLPFLDADGSAIDRGLALFFPAPHSYTGEDVLELQAHGGAVSLQLLLARCLQAGEAIGLRLARPGEFTERAFLNDKMDLAQAEAVADLIDASTEAAARSASRSLSGDFSRHVEALHRRLVDLRTLVEATLDFPEEDIEFLQRAAVAQRIDTVHADLAALLANARAGALLREGLRVVLAGQPNVGKSSLLNALAGAELAIVSATPGTTRDRIGETIQIEGVPLHVIDTAGLRDDSGDAVERIGIERSWQSIAAADSVIFLHDLTRAHHADYAAAEQRIAERLRDAPSIVHVYTKLDLATPVADALNLSSRTGEGLQALRRQLLRQAGWQAPPEGVFIARQRHVQALQATRRHVEAARTLLQQSAAPLELLAEELRAAHEALADITGRFSSDDLLGEIFGRFCIGK